MASPKAKSRILVADDDSSILRVVTMILAHEGMKVITAEDGEQAYQKAVTQLPDAILLDINMPKLNGFEVFEKLKATHNTTNIPVAFFTAHKDFESFKKAQDMGGLIYISKPFKPDTLINSVELLLTSRVRLPDT